MDLYLGLILPSALPFAPVGFLPCDGRTLNMVLSCTPQLHIDKLKG
jgi:microcystin-dependent protein